MILSTLAWQQKFSGRLEWQQIDFLSSQYSLLMERQPVISTIREKRWSSCALMGLEDASCMDERIFFLYFARIGCVVDTQSSTYDLLKPNIVITLQRGERLRIHKDGNSRLGSLLWQFLSRQLNSSKTKLIESIRFRHNNHRQSMVLSEYNWSVKICCKSLGRCSCGDARTGISRNPVAAPDLWCSLFVGMDAYKVNVKNKIHFVHGTSTPRNQRSQA